MTAGYFQKGMRAKTEPAPAVAESTPNSAQKPFAASQRSEGAKRLRIFAYNILHIAFARFFLNRAKAALSAQTERLFSSADRLRGSDNRRRPPTANTEPSASRPGREMRKNRIVAARISSHKSTSQTNANRIRRILKKNSGPEEIEKKLHAVYKQRQPVRPAGRQHQIGRGPHQDVQHRPHHREQPPRRRKRRLGDRLERLHAAARQQRRKSADRKRHGPDRR